MSLKKYFKIGSILSMAIVMIVAFQNCGDGFELSSSVLESLSQAPNNEGGDGDGSGDDVVNPTPAPITEPLPQPTPEPLPAPIPEPEPDPDRPPGASETLPNGVILLKDTHRGLGNKGDNWTLTWAADDSVLVTMDDGDWLSENGYGNSKYSHAMYRISNGGSKFTMNNVTRLTGYPTYKIRDACHFGYGLISAKNQLFSLVSKCTGIHWGYFHGMKVLKSTNNGASWTGDSKYLFHKDFDFVKKEVRYVDGQPYYPFTMATFVQAGKNYQHNKDGYLYVYSPNPKSTKTIEIDLARVKIDQIESESNWQYFKGIGSDGAPSWDNSLANRKPMFSYTENGLNWYSYLPDIAYNADLGLYMMVNGAIYSSSFNARGTDVTKSGSLIFYYSKNPYGPWVEFDRFDNFKVNSGDKTYQPKFDPKRITENGTKMVLVWSDFGGNFNVEHYRFNEMQIKIDLAAIRSFLPNQTYHIENKQFNKCLTPLDSIHTSGQPVVMATCKDGSTLQNVYFDHVSADIYRLRMAGYCLGLRQAKTDNGTIIELQTCLSAAKHQQFKKAGDQLISQAVSSYEAVIDVHAQTGIDVILWENGNNENKKFIFK